MSGIAAAAAIALTGLDGAVVIVEAAVSQELPGIAIIGLPDAAVAEAKQRVKLAAKHTGQTLTDRFLMINLSPAALPKHGSGFDLAIAVAALGASGALTSDRARHIAHIGELGLDGSVRRPSGLLSAVMQARELGFTTVMVPARAATEARLVEGVELVAVEDLRGAVNWYRGVSGGWSQVEPQHAEDSASAYLSGERSEDLDEPDMGEVLGQPEAVEGMVIAAAGRHNVSMTGPPGSGKTMLARRLASLLPDLSPAEALTVSSIASLTRNSALTGLVRRPPFEQPHHTSSPVAIIGGGQGGIVRPGAITRACHGVLFLDEAAEFNRAVLDALRQPLESGTIDIHRAHVHVRLPAQVQLVLASNPCPCGRGGSPVTELECSCSSRAKRSYAAKISDPLRDRIDVRLEVQRVTSTAIDAAWGRPASSAELKRRITAARSAMAERLKGTPWSVNAEVPGAWLRDSHMKLTSSDLVVLDTALARGSITLRGYDRALRLAWSIGDLAGKSMPGRSEIAQALDLRGGDR